jgi:hypothetical protein
MNQATSPSRPAARFHVPFEHGAWWSFGSTLAGGLAVALLRRADPAACGGVVLALGAGFMLQDWAQALLAALLRRRSQALSQWGSPWGWGLAALALGGVVLQLWRVEPAERAAWIGLWALAAVGMAAGLLSRILQSGRGRQSLAFTALLLSAPALPLGALAFGFTGRLAAFTVWPLLYYPAVTLAAQSYIRGFPEGARASGPAMAAVLGFAAAAAGAWLPTALMLGNGMHLWGSIRTRWRDHPAGLPPGAAIRDFGKTQAALGITLTLLWVWNFGVS